MLGISTFLEISLVFLLKLFKNRQFLLQVKNVLAEKTAIFYYYCKHEETEL